MLLAYKQPRCVGVPSIKSDTYLTPNKIAMINLSHNRIVTLRPDILGIDEEESVQHKISDLIHDTDALFVNYFKKQKGGQEPNEDIMKLFHEILAK
jgi:hypothetical protein